MLKTEGNGAPHTLPTHLAQTHPVHHPGEDATIPCSRGVSTYMTLQ